MKTPRFELLLLIVSLTFFLVSCEKETQHPLPNGIPDKDIVFVPEEYPAYTNAEISTLGFIDADGTGLEEYSFLFAGGAKSMYGMESYTQYADNPHWSPSGNSLIFGIRNTAPNIRLIDLQGYMYGKNCDAIGDSTTFDKNGYIIKILHKFDRIFDQYKHLTDENHIALVRFDLKNCTVVSVSSLSVPITSSSVFEISNETANGRFVISYSETDIPNFFIYVPMKNSYQVFSGFFPELNNDGSLLAYYSEEGELIVVNLETGDEKSIAQVAFNESALAHDISNPSWSPDSQWLVYSTDDGDIYKINVSTEEKIYLTHGWSPDWR